MIFYRPQANFIFLSSWLQKAKSLESSHWQLSELRFADRLSPTLV